jgi:hypothetical protein
VYLGKRKKDLFAMIRQLGLPTWFGSLSSADTKWNDLLRVLARLNDGTEKSDEELEKMNWNEKTKLVQKDPAVDGFNTSFAVHFFSSDLHRLKAR